MATAAMTTRVAPQDESDRELAAGLTGGAASAFDELVRRHYRQVTRLAYRLLGWDREVDDVVQDVFLAALQKSRQFRGDCSLLTWLTVITLNRCRSYQRRGKVWRRVRGLLSGRRASESAAPDEASLADETAREVRTAVAALPPRDREVVVLFYLEHRSAEQIGELLGTTRNAIEVRLHRARTKLRVALAGLMKE